MTTETVLRRVEACPWCSSQDFEKIATRLDRIPVMRCNVCHLGFTGKLPDDLAVFYDEEYYARNAYTGPGAPTGYENYEASYSPSSFRWLTLILRAIVGNRPARLLDIGTATGTFLEMARYEGFEVAGSELNEAGAHNARAKGLEVKTGAFDPADWHPMKFDVITALEVLEHVTDLRSTLLKVKTLLAPDGLFCFFVPNVPDHLVKQYGNGYLDFNKSFDHTLYLNPPTLKIIFTEVFGAGGLSLLTKDVPEGDQTVSFAFGIVRQTPMPDPPEARIFDLIERSIGPEGLAGLHPSALMATAVSAAKFFDFDLAELAIRSASASGVDPHQMAPANAQIYRNKGELLKAIEILLPVAKLTRLSDPLPSSLLIELVEELLPHLEVSERGLDHGLSALVIWVEKAREALTKFEQEADHETLSESTDRVAELTTLLSEVRDRWHERDRTERIELAELRDRERQARLDADRARESAVALRGISSRLAADKEHLEAELSRVYVSRAWRMVSALRALKQGFREILATPARLVRALGRAKESPSEGAATIASVATIRSEPSHVLSVVIPVFNKGWDLVAAVDSVLESTIKDVEVVIWDDGSDDPDTIAAMQAAAGMPGVSIFHGPNRGVVAARNSAMAATDGHFICCLDPDDRVDPTYFEKAVSLLLSSPGIGIAYPWVDVTGDEAGIWQTEDLNPSLLRTANHVPVSAVFRREAFHESGGFAKRMAEGYEDWEYWATLAELGFRGKVIPEPLFHYVHQMDAEASRDARARQAHDELVATIQRLHPGLRDNIRQRPPSPPPIQPIKLRRSYPRGIGRPIVLTIPWLTVGGADRLVRWLVGHWAQQNRTVVVIATEPMGQGMKDEFADLFKLTPYAYKLDNFLPRDRWEEFVDEVITALEDPILLNIGSNWLYDHLPTLKASFPGITVVDQQFNEVGHLAANSRNARAIDLTIAAYQSLATRLEADGRKPGKVRTIHIGVDKPAEVGAMEVTKFRNSLKIPTNAKVILWVGRMSTEKRPEWIVRMAEQLGNQETRFLMVGDGPLARELGPRISNCPWIVWQRHLGSLDVAYAAADLMVVTSTVEGVPLTLMESLMAGVPAIATRVGGIPDLEAINGVVTTAPDDYQEMAHQVRRLIKSPPMHAAPSEEFGLDGMLELYDAALMEDIKS